MILKADNILNVLLTPACQAVITKTTQEHILSLQYHAVALKKGEHRHQLTHRASNRNGCCFGENRKQ